MRSRPAVASEVGDRGLDRVLDLNAIPRGVLGGCNLTHLDRVAERSPLDIVHPRCNLIWAKVLWD